jgi:protein-serine/threonine kinase
MIHLIFGGAIWDTALPDGKNPMYDSLVRGWSKWHDERSAEGPTITDTEYPYVKAFDQNIKPPALRRLLLLMLHPEPSKRSSIEIIINNRWMRRVECCQVNDYDDNVKIDASKKSQHLSTSHKIFYHNHLPPMKKHGQALVRVPSY